MVSSCDGEFRSDEIVIVVRDIISYLGIHEHSEGSAAMCGVVVRIVEYDDRTSIV